MSDGSTFTGSLIDGKMEGKGTYKLPPPDEQCEYQGDFKDDRLDGNGVFKEKDGRIYEGQFKEGKKHGFGIYTWKNSIRYEGFWKEGV